MVGVAANNLAVYNLAENLPYNFTDFTEVSLYRKSVSWQDLTLYTRDRQIAINFYDFV